MLKRFLPLVLLCASGVLGAEPARDRFGDPLPEGAIARLGSLHLRNDELITTTAFTKDGKTLATAGSGFISFWDLATGKLARRTEIEKSTALVRLMRLSAGGKTLIYSHSNHRNVLYVVDASSGAQQRTVNLAKSGSIESLDLSRDGTILAVVSWGSIALWDVPNAKLLHEFKGPLPRTLPPRTTVALTPDGKQLVLPHADGSLHLVDVKSGKELRAVEMPLPSGRSFSSRLQRLAVSPDGRYLAFEGMTTPLTVCELATGKRLHELAPAQRGFSTGAAFTPDGRVLAVDDHTGIRLYDVASGKQIRKLDLKPGNDDWLLFSPDGRTLAVVGAYTIKLWDMTAERWLHPLMGHEGIIRSLAFFPDGKRLVSDDSTSPIRVWDIPSGQTLVEKKNTFSVVSLAVDRDGETVRFADYQTSAHRWDPRSGRDEVQKRMIDGLSTNMLALSSDGQSLAVLVPNSGAQPNRQLRLYDVKSNQSIVLRGLSERSLIVRMLFTPDGRRLAACFQDGALLLWDRDTGKLVGEPKSDAPMPQLMHLAFAADGRSFLALFGGKVRIRELSSDADRLQIPPVHGLNALAYAPDACFVACGQSDGRILVYSAISGKPLAQWQGKQDSVHALAFSSDSRFLASGGANGTILIWKVPQDESVPVVRNAKEAASLWQALDDTDAAAANRALAGLAAAPAQALPLFLERSAESKKRMEALLSRLKNGDDSSRLRFVRALEVLERIGTPPAKEVLRALAGKSLSVDLREEVRATLRRLGDKP